MAFQRKGLQDKAWIADYKSDLAKLPIGSMGSTCWVIETAEKYMINSKGEWILQTTSTNGIGGIPGVPGSYVTVEQMNAQDAAIIAHSDAQDKAILDQVNSLNEENTVWNELAE